MKKRGEYPKSDFRTDHDRLGDLLQEARRLLAAFHKSVQDVPDWKSSIQAALDFCATTQYLRFWLVTGRTADEEAHWETINVLYEFATIASSFLKRPDVRAAKRERDIATIRDAITQCTKRCERVREHLEVKEELQTVLWSISPNGALLSKAGLSVEERPDDDFELREYVASGCYGNIWKTLQKSLNRIVAVKIIRAPMNLQSSAIEHAQALARLNHPNVVTVYTVAKVTDPDTKRLADGIVMEWLDGSSLESRLLEELFEIEEGSAVCLAVLDAVEALHGCGLTHGDLHAGNVVLCDGTVKVIDVNYSHSQSLALFTGSHDDCA